MLKKKLGIAVIMVPSEDIGHNSVKHETFQRYSAFLQVKYVFFYIC